MAPKYTLHSTKENKNTYKALIAAKYAGVQIDVPDTFEFGKTNKTPEFLKLNPNGKVSAHARTAPRFTDTFHDRVVGTFFE